MCRGGWSLILLRGRGVFRRSRGRGGYPSGPDRGDYPLPFYEPEKTCLVMNSGGTGASVHAARGGGPPPAERQGGGGVAGLFDEGGGTPPALRGGTTPPLTSLSIDAHIVSICRSPTCEGSFQNL